MIQLICGPKGTGKTKIILDKINETVSAAKGDIVFITDKRINTVSVNFKVRCLYADEFDVKNVEQFTGFVKGLFAGNADIEYLFIDGLTRIIGDDSADVEKFFAPFEVLEKDYCFKAVISVSEKAEDLPAVAAKYAE